MTINKYFNHNYDGAIPFKTGDRWYAQDSVLETRSLQDLLGSFISSNVIVPSIISGGTVTQGTGDTLVITQGAGYVKFSVEIPDSFASTPPTRISKDIEAMPVSWATQVNLDISSATLDSFTLNYVKISYVETDLNFRDRAKSAGNYAYEVEKDFVITVDATPPTDYEVCLASFKGVSAGTFIITVANRSKQFNLTAYDYVIKDQDDFNNLFERTSANIFKIPDAVKSLYIENGTYDVPTFSTIYNGEYLILNTNNCKRIDCNDAVFDYDSLDGYLNINTDKIIIEGLTIQGDNTTSLGTSYTFYVNTVRATLKDCNALERKGSVTGFEQSSNTLRSSYNHCVADQMGGDGFKNCNGLTTCTSTNNIGDGFKNCNGLTTCTSTNNIGYGFDLCLFIDVSCYANNNSGGNFLTSFGPADPTQKSPCGCGTEGTPIFLYTDSKDILSGNFSGVFTHNISNAVDNFRVLHVTGSIKSGGICRYPSAVSDTTIPQHLALSNTAVSVLRGLTGIVVSCCIYVTYR